MPRAAEQRRIGPARAREAFGGVDVLVNNAGLLGGLSVLDMPLDRWQRQIAANLVIVSTAGHQGQAGNIGYCYSLTS